MAVSKSPGHERGNGRQTNVRDWLPSDRYDLVLAVIPLLYLAALVGHVAFDVPVRTTLLTTSIAGAFLLVDALYLNPPTTGDGR